MKFYFRPLHLSVCLIIKMAIKGSAAVVPISLPRRYSICDDLSCKNLDVKVKKVRIAASCHSKDPPSFAFFCSGQWWVPRVENKARTIHSLWIFSEHSEICTSITLWSRTVSIFNNPGYGFPPWICQSLCESCKILVSVVSCVKELPCLPIIVWGNILHLPLL